MYILCKLFGKWTRNPLTSNQARTFQEKKITEGSPLKHRCKNSYQNIGYQNPTTYKKGNRDKLRFILGTQGH